MNKNETDESRLLLVELSLEEKDALIRALVHEIAAFLYYGVSKDEVSLLKSAIKKLKNE